MGGHPVYGDRVPAPLSTHTPEPSGPSGSCRPPRLTLRAARRIALLSQGFGRRRPEPVGQSHLLAAVRRMGIVQIDSVNVLVLKDEELIAVRLPATNELWVLEREATASAPREALDQSSATLRTRSEDLAGIDSVVIASEPIESPEGFAEGHAEAAAHIRGLAGQERAALVAAMLDDVEMRDAGSYPAGETLGWLVAAIRDGEARDEATLRIHAGSARRWFEFWSHVSRFTDGEQAVVPLALSALAAWVHGDGATALIATERAAAIEPDHLLVRLVQTCVQQCLPPQVWERFLAAFPNASVLIEQNENGEVAS